MRISLRPCHSFQLCPAASQRPQETAPSRATSSRWTIKSCTNVTRASGWKPVNKQARCVGKMAHGATEGRRLLANVSVPESLPIFVGLVGNQMHRAGLQVPRKLPSHTVCLVTVQTAGLFHIEGSGHEDDCAPWKASQMLPAGPECCDQCVQYCVSIWGH